MCHKELGTVEHRFNCERTRPDKGWPEAPEEVKASVQAIGERGNNILKTKGLVCVKVPAYKRFPNGTFSWLSEAPDVSRTDLVWYTDGSTSNPTCPELSRLGFAIVVVSDAGDLVAFGAGVPPSHVTDSGMAETWAVWIVLEMCSVTPRIITDCLGILNTARSGTALATTGRSPNARTWNLIKQALDGDVTVLADELVWMPAHQKLR